MPTDPDELLAHHDPGEPWLQWGCALCDHRAVLSEELEAHTAAAADHYREHQAMTTPSQRLNFNDVRRRLDDFRRVLVAMNCYLDAVSRKLQHAESHDDAKRLADLEERIDALQNSLRVH